MGVTRGPGVEDTSTMCSERCSSLSLIFLIASTPHRVALKLDIRGRLVWFFASSRKRPSGAVCPHSSSPLVLQKLHLLHVGEY